MFIVSKPFSNLLNKGKDKDKNLSFSKSLPDQKFGGKSMPLIFFGIITSLSSIFLLLFTINNKFG